MPYSIINLRLHRHEELEAAGCLCRNCFRNSAGPFPAPGSLCSLLNASVRGVSDPSRCRSPNGIEFLIAPGTERKTNTGRESSRTDGKFPRIRFWFVLCFRWQKIIFKKALERTASAIILCHNHPSGNLNPSKADIDLTNKLVAFGKYIDMPVLDHLIITHDSYFSFADKGML